MQVIEISEPGGPEVLVQAEREKPTPAAGQILIEVHAAGVNRPDALQRAGSYNPPPDASDLPGLECAGIVVGLGEGVSRWAIGDEVCALLPGGGYAEYALTHADHALPIPKGLSMVEAAGLCETFFTVWANVFDRGHLQAGERLLIHGGSSGIGTTAIQLAHAFGARVFVTAGSDEKCEACLTLGAEAAINYKTQDFVKEIRALTGNGVDMVLDMVGGDYVARNLKCLREDGRLVFIAFLGGPVSEVNFAAVMVKRISITGSTLRPRTAEAKAEIARALEAQVWPRISAGQIAPVIDKTFALKDAKAAHQRMESSDHVGKLILTVK